MAKKKTAAEVKEAAKAKGKKVFADDPVSTLVCKKYGDIVEEGNIVLKNLIASKILPFSPALDLALGGGIQEGGVILITGDPKTGKTTAALHFAAKCQKIGKKIVYLNTEERLSLHNFEGIKGLDAGAMKIVQSTDECPVVSAEDYLNTLETYIKNTKNLVAIVDSTSYMATAEELDGEIRTGIRPGAPKLLKMFFKRNTGDIRRNKAIIILITHNITNTNKTSPHQPDKHADGGVAQQYQAQTNILITGRGKWEATKDSGDHVGQKIFWNVRTSPTGRPNTTAEGWLRYGVGIDDAQEAATMAVEFSIITGSGWYTIQPLIDMRLEKSIAKWLKANSVDPENEEAVTKFVKFQGMNKLVAFITEHEFIVDILTAKIKELFV